MASDTTASQGALGRPIDGPPGSVARPPDRAPARTRRVQTLAEAFSPGRNSLAMMRLGLAGTVAWAHAWAVGFGHQPDLGETHLADFAVDGFFVLSGFLVARSYLRLESLGRFVWHRFLRIMPGFWVCLLLTALVAAPLAAALIGRSPLSVFTTDHEPAWRYVVANWGLPILQYGIGDVSGPRGQTVFDGSLWTLQYEAFCYAVVAVLGLTAVLRRRRWAVLVLVACVWIGALLDRAALIPVDVPLFANDNLLRFLLVFLLGVAGWLYADRLPVRRGLALGSAVVVVASAFLPDYRLTAALCFAYLCLYGVVRLPLRYTPSWDLSYGLYIYHWPIQFLLVLAGVTVVGGWWFAVLTLTLTLIAASASWLLVEGPALRMKDWRKRPRAAQTP